MDTRKIAGAFHELFVDAGGDLYAAGRDLWCWSADGMLRWRVPGEGKGFFRLQAGPLEMVQAQHGDAIARVGRDGTIRTTLSVARGIALAFDERLQANYVGGARYVLTIAADGHEVRRAAVDEGPFAAVVSSGTLYVTAGALYAFGSDGTERWQFRPRDLLASTPVVDQDGDIVVAGRRRVFALRPDGVLRWQAEMLQASDNVLQVMPRGRDIYIQGWFSDGPRLMRLSTGGS